MNPLNLIADADILRIKGDLDASRETITWTVEARIPDPRVEEPGTTHTILTFRAPVGDDPATAYAIPEGLECLVTAAASLYGLGVATAPVDPPIAAFNALRRRVEAQLDAAVLPEGRDYEVSPAPRCSHNFLGPHTVTAGSVASGYIETECPGPARIACGWHAGTGIDPACAFCNPGPDTIKVESLEETHDPASIRVTGTTLEDAPERGPLEGHVLKAERDGDTIRLEVAYRVPPIIDGPIDLRITTDPPQDSTVRRCRHGEVGPHGTDALDRGPTCPGPVLCEHGHTAKHVVSVFPHATCPGPTDLDHIKAGWCPTHYTPLDPQGQCTHLDHNTNPATHGTSTQAPEPGSSAPRDPEPGASARGGRLTCLAYIGLGVDGVVRCSQPVPCPAHDPEGDWQRKEPAPPAPAAKPRTPVCATCEAEIVPATGWGRGWVHRDRTGKSHIPVPKIFIDPPPKSTLRAERH